MIYLNFYWNHLAYIKLLMKEKYKFRGILRGKLFLRSSIHLYNNRLVWIELLFFHFISSNGEMSYLKFYDAFICCKVFNFVKISYILSHMEVNTRLVRIFAGGSVWKSELFFVNSTQLTCAFFNKKNYHICPHMCLV